MGWAWFYLSSWVKISWNLFWQIQIQLKSVLCKRRELVRENNDKHVMNVFRCLMRFELILEKILCGRNCMKSAKEQQHNFKRNS